MHFLIHVGISSSCHISADAWVSLPPAPPLPMALSSGNVLMASTNATRLAESLVPLSYRHRLQSDR